MPRIALLATGIIFLLRMSQLVDAQSVHTVQVGFADELSFSPQNVVADPGDVVQFIFTSSNHSVTQSTSADPCAPLVGGFNSGFVAAADSTTSTTAAGNTAWNLTVSSSEPIWYFCAQVTPLSHCASGIVGAINPPSIAAFESFVSVARQATTSISTGSVTSSPSNTNIILSGSGAFATAPPSPTGAGTSSKSSTASHSQALPSPPSISPHPSATPPSTNTSDRSVSLEPYLPYLAFFTAVVLLGVLPCTI